MYPNGIYLQFVPLPPTMVSDAGISQGVPDGFPTGMVLLPMPYYPSGLPDDAQKWLYPPWVSTAGWGDSQGAGVVAEVAIELPNAAAALAGDAAGVYDFAAAAATAVGNVATDEEVDAEWQEGCEEGYDEGYGGFDEYCAGGFEVGYGVEEEGTGHRRRGRSGRKRRGRRPVAAPIAEAAAAAAQATSEAATWEPSTSSAPCGVAEVSGARSSRRGRGKAAGRRGGNGALWGDREFEGIGGRDRCPLPGFAKYKVRHLYDDSDFLLKVTNALEDKGLKMHWDAICAWVLPHLKELSLASQQCSRLVQQSIKSATTELAKQMAAALIPHMWELYLSPNANHVVSKVIEVVPNLLELRILEQIDQITPLALARHRFGCRILERLIEHCKEQDLEKVASVYVQHAADLCKHQFGNFVVQHLLEHGSSELRSRICAALLPKIQELSQHRTASHVVQMALKHSVPDQAELVDAILGQSGDAFVEVSCSRYGNYVVEQILNISFEHKVLVRDNLATASPAQREMPNYQRLSEMAVCPLEPGTSPPRAGPAAGIVESAIEGVARGGNSQAAAGQQPAGFWRH